MTKTQEKKLNKLFKMYVDRRKGALTIFNKKTGLLKGSIRRDEVYPTPQFVYDLHLSDVEITEHDLLWEEKKTVTRKDVYETYDTFDEAVTRLLELV